jgi:hypothetical protein
MRKLLLLLTVLLLFGCASRDYDHPTKSSADFDRDQSDCLDIATKKANQLGLATNAIWIHEEMRQCLERQHGWTLRQTVP